MIPYNRFLHRLYHASTTQVWGVSCICRRYWRRMFYRNSVVISLNVCWESISKNYFYFKLNEHSKGNTTYCNCTGCFEWLCRTVYYVCCVGYSVLYYCCWLYKALLLNWTKHSNNQPRFDILLFCAETGGRGPNLDKHVKGKIATMSVTKCLWGNEERSAVIYLYSAGTPAWTVTGGALASRWLSVFTSPPNS